MNEYVALVAGWIIYFILHSVLASTTVKATLNPRGGRMYRILYTAGSTVGLLALVIYGATLHGEPFFNSHGMIRYVSLMLSTFGVMTIQLAFRQYRLKPFIGLEEEKNQLKIEGILKTIRHPIYSGVILITLGFFLFNPTVSSLVACMSIFLYLPAGIYLEERKLIAQYGDEYRKYRSDVPALIPSLKKTKGN